MTITSVKLLEPATFSRSSGRNSPKPLAKVWDAPEPPFKGYHEAPTDGYRQSSDSTAIVIDNGKVKHPPFRLL